MQSVPTVACRPAVPSIQPTERTLLALLILNVFLQAFDGVATYSGLRVGFGEGNPLLAYAMETFGLASTLIVAKLTACVLLAVLWVHRQSPLALPGLAFTAVVYVGCSLGPWSAALAHAHLH